MYLHALYCSGILYQHSHRSATCSCPLFSTRLHSTRDILPLCLPAFPKEAPIQGYWYSRLLLFGGNRGMITEQQKGGSLRSSRNHHCAKVPLPALLREPSHQPAALVLIASPTATVLTENDPFSALLPSSRFRHLSGGKTHTFLLELSRIPYNFCSCMTQSNLTLLLFGPLLPSQGAGWTRFVW